MNYKKLGITLITGVTLFGNAIPALAEGEPSEQQQNQISLQTVLQGVDRTNPGAVGNAIKNSRLCGPVLFDSDRMKELFAEFPADPVFVGKVLHIISTVQSSGTVGHALKKAGIQNPATVGKVLNAAHIRFGDSIVNALNILEIKAPTDVLQVLLEVKLISEQQINNVFQQMNITEFPKVDEMKEIGDNDWVLKNILQKVTKNYKNNYQINPLTSQQLLGAFLKVYPSLSATQALAMLQIKNFTTVDDITKVLTAMHRTPKDLKSLTTRMFRESDWE